MHLKYVCTALIIACFASTSFSASSSPIRQIEIAAIDSPYSQIESLKQRLTDAELRLAAPLPREIQAALTENPEITAAMSPDGWEHVFFKGIGDAQMKQSGSRSLFKIPAAKMSDGLLVMALAMKSMISCGGGNVCIALDSKALATKPKPSEVN